MQPTQSSPPLYGLRLLPQRRRVRIDAGARRHRDPRLPQQVASVPSALVEVQIDEERDDVAVASADMVATVKESAREGAHAADVGADRAALEGSLLVTGLVDVGEDGAASVIPERGAGEMRK